MKLTVFILLQCALVIISTLNAAVLNENIDYYNNTSTIQDRIKNIKSNQKIQFTNKEIEWIKNNPVIKIGSGNNWPPFNYVDSDGEFKGITKDYLNLISKISGLKIDLSVGAWKEIYQMFLDGKLQILPAALYNKEREKFGHFEKAHIKLRDFIYARADDDTINSFSDLNGKTLVRIKKYATLDPYLPHLHDVKIVEVNNMLEMINVVYNKKADAFLESQPSVNHILKENMIGGLKSIAQSVALPTTAHMLIKKDETILYSIIKKSLKSIDDKTRNEIYDRWVKLDSGKEQNIRFTDKEWEWLRKNKTIKIVSGPAWPPFDFYDKKTGTYEGIGQEYFKKVSELTGIEFENVKVESWDDAINKIKNKEADMFTIAKETPQRRGYLNFTDTFISYPVVIVTLNNIDFISDIDELRGKKIVLIKNFAITEIVKKDYPKLNITEVKDAYEALKLVSSGKADAFLGSLGTVTYVIKDGGFFNLKIAGKTDYKFSWGAAVRNDWPKEAVSVLNKVFNAISDEEKNKIYNKWVSLKLEEQINYTLLYKVAGGLILFVLVTLYWNRKISNAKEFTTMIMDSQIDIVITTTGNNIIMGNKAFLDFFELHTLEEFKYNCISEVFEKREDFLQNRINDKLWLDHILLNPKVSHKAILNNHIFKVNVKEAKFGNKKLYVVVLSDITKIEKARKKLEEQKEKTEQVLSHILLPILITSKQSRKILFANPYAQEKYGVPLDKLIGMDIDEFYTVKNQKDLILSQMDENGVVENIEQEFRTFDGRVFEGLLSLIGIEYDNEPAYIGMVTDISEQKHRELELKTVNKKVRDSINYASLIQHSLIPESKHLERYFSDFFIIWEPKDIVGGDIYIFEPLGNDDESLLMVIDCTGHGVPGAFVTMLVKAIEMEILGKIFHYKDEVSPSKILSVFNKSMKKLLKQENKDAISNVGFDAGILYYDKKRKIIRYSGAEIALFYMDNGELKIIKGDRQSVGYVKSDSVYEYKEHTIGIKEGMQFYITTDGFIDQNGGDKDFSFGKKRFRSLIEDYHEKNFSEQKEIFKNSLYEYQGDGDRNDDITVVGFKI